MITKVTVTGADDKTNQKDLIELAKRYPFVEFGILLSKSQEGNQRFPSGEWIDKLDFLSKESNVPINCSGHICGSWVRELLVGNMTNIGEIINNYGYSRVINIEIGLFKRWQINTHGIKHKYNYWFYGPILKEFNKRHQEVIFQFDNINTELLQNAINQMCVISALVDLSHGAGVLPTNWSKPQFNGSDLIYWGYAGGLSCDNIVFQIEKIKEISGDQSFWIDAETHLRTNEEFDLNKVDKFLKLAEPYTKYL